MLWGINAPIVSCYVYKNVILKKIFVRGDDDDVQNKNYCKHKKNHDVDDDIK